MPQPKTESPVCPVCAGVGYTVVERNGLGYAGACVCQGERLKVSVADRAGIPARFSDTTFETFKVAYESNPVAARLLSSSIIAAKSWAREFPFPVELRSGKRQQGLLFTGDTGCGKTHLAVSALKHVLSWGFSGVFCDYRTLLSQVANSWKPGAAEEEREALKFVVEADALLIDDLGAQRNMEWAEDAITEIISQRYNARKAVIVTTNLPLIPRAKESGFGGGFTRLSRVLGEVIGERSRSRLIEMCKVVDMFGIEDYRERQAGLR